MPWEVIVSVIVREKVHINMCLMPSSYQDGAVCNYKRKSVVSANEER